MFTVEMDHDEVTVTVLDNDGHYDDVELILYDDIIYVRQYDAQHDLMQMIAMSPEMFNELRAAMKHPAGTYLTKHK
jgi:Mg/Co/Ni transporter MgtE